MTLVGPSRSLMCGRSPRCVAEAAQLDPAKPAEELQRLHADRAHVDLGVDFLRLADRAESRLEQVQIERTGEAPIGADHDDADGAHRALQREGMLVVEIHLAQVADDLADLLRVRTRGAHAFLRLAHLARRDHLHGLGDLLSILDARDLAADFFCACHCSSLGESLTALRRIRRSTSSAPPRLPSSDPAWH